MHSLLIFPGIAALENHFYLYQEGVELLSVEASPKGVKKHRRVITEQYDTPGQYKQRISLLVSPGTVGGIRLQHFDGFTPTLLKHEQPWHQYFQGDHTCPLAPTLSQGALRERDQVRRTNIQQPAFREPT